MRIDDMPEDGNDTLEGQRKAVYAQDRDGTIRIVPSQGWSVEEAVTRQAVEEFDRLAADALARWRQGLTSPLEVLMYRRRMDVALLAQVTGTWAWRVRRHLKPAVFARLSPAWLQRYAEALGVEVAELKEPR